MKIGTGHSEIRCRKRWGKERSNQKAGKTKVVAEAKKMEEEK